MTDPVFGIKVTRIDDQSLPVIGADLSTIGLIGPAADADETVFPLDTPVLVYSNDLVTLAKLGADGYLPDAFNGINDQLGDLDLAARVVVVRTDYGVSTDLPTKMIQTIAGVMGSSVAGTGMWAFLKAPALLACTPRVICAPGYTGQMANSVGTLTVAVAGAGYTPGKVYPIDFSAGGTDPNIIQAVGSAIADSHGDIETIDLTIASFGAWYTEAPTATLPAPDGPTDTGVAATGMVSFGSQPTPESTLTLDGVVITFVTGTPTGSEVELGVDKAATCAALLTFLQAATTGSLFLASYELDVAGTDVIITYKTVGTSGNAWTMATNVPGAVVSGATLTGGVPLGGTQCTLTATMVLGANPVCAGATAILNGLSGHMIAESAGTSQQDDDAWRSSLDSQRIIGVVGGVKILDPVSALIIARPFAPRVAGLIIARDNATGAPFHSAANQPVQGIVGPLRAVGFSLTDGDNEGQQLLTVNMGIIVQGEAGIETAIASGGYIFIGTDNLGDDPLWQFYNITRGRDFIELSLIRTLRTYLGRQNITGLTIQSVLNTIGAFLALLQARDNILGYKLSFNGAQNSADQIRLGRLSVGFQAEEPPVLREINLQSARYRPAIDVMVGQLAAQLGSIAA